MLKKLLLITLSAFTFVCLFGQENDQHVEVRVGWWGDRLVSASPVCLSYGENDKEFIFTRIEDSEIAELAAHKNSQCVKQPDSKDCRDITQKFDELAKMIKTLHIMAKDVKKTETK